MNTAVPDTYEPHLSVRNPRQQAVGSRKGVLGDLEVAAVYIHGDDLTFVPGFHLWSHMPLVHFCAAAGVFFFAVARLPHGHRLV